MLSREEIGRLEDTAKTERDKLIVRVLADAGLRVTEMTGIRTTDLIERDRRGWIAPSSCQRPPANNLDRPLRRQTTA